MFGFTRDEATKYMKEQGYDEDFDDWVEAPEILSSFWDDVGSARPSEFNDFYMAE